MGKPERITIQVKVNAPVGKAWEYWNDPLKIVQWYTATPDWHTPKVTNELKVDGRFLYRMEAKDGSIGFNFEGTYTNVVPHQLIEYTIPDGRQVTVRFQPSDEGTLIIESFDPEDQNPLNLQHDGWMAILENFKKGIESK